MKKIAIVELFLIVGCVLVYFVLPTLLLPTSEISFNNEADIGLDEELSKGVEFIDESTKFIEQKQYEKAREMIENAKESSDVLLKRTSHHEDGENYLNTLINCTDSLIHVMELSNTNDTVGTIGHANKFLVDFSNLKTICAELAEKHPDIAEKLNIEETMVNLRPIEYDIMDFKEEYETNKTPPLLPISFEGSSKEFTWKDHLGKKWNFKIKISERKYKKYINISHEVNVSEDILKFVADEDVQVREIAQWFNDTYSDQEDKANCILSFVQECVPSIAEGRDDYFKYPIETIIEGGDCEDKSILFLSILKAEGYDVAFASYPQHWMGGVALKGDLKRVKNPYSGIPIEGGGTYYLCETLDKGFKVGSILEEYKNINPIILVIPR
jgi:hypothetical protein